MDDFVGYLVTGIVALFSGAALERFKSREWLKQEQWRYKRDLYERLFRGFADYATHLRFLQVAEEENSPQARRDEFFEKTQVSQIEIERLVPLAKVFASEETMKKLYAFSNEMNRVHSAPKGSGPQAIYKAAEDAANVALGSLTESATKDLEFQPTRSLLDEVLGDLGAKS